MKTFIVMERLQVTNKYLVDAESLEQAELIFKDFQNGEDVESVELIDTDESCFENPTFEERGE